MEIIRHFGPQSHLYHRAVDQLLRVGCENEQPISALSQKAIAGLQKRFPKSSERPECLYACLRKYYWCLVLQVGRTLAPNCNLTAGLPSADEQVIAIPEDDAAKLSVAVVHSDADVFRLLYEALFPREVRHARGEFNTPDWLAALALEKLEYCGGGRILDPSCGSGVFLKQAANLLGGGAAAVDAIYGFDTNPLAVLTARVNLIASLGKSNEQITECPHIYLHDCIREANQWGRFNCIIGNPPWVLWDNLPVHYREQTTALWKNYGLFNLPHTQARLGGGKKDLAMLFTYAAADKYLDNGGRLAFVISQGLLQSARAAGGFRRFRIGEEGEHLRVLSVDDLAAVNPFDAAVRPSIIVLEKGSETRYPVPYAVWGKKSTGKMQPTYKYARPVSGRTGAWRVSDIPEEAAVESSGTYVARTGAYTGGANAVFWLRLIDNCDSHIIVENLFSCGRNETKCQRSKIEPDLVYPLLRWRDVHRWQATPRQHILLPQDLRKRQALSEEFLSSELPLTLDYLAGFRTELLSRKSKMIRDLMARSGFYAMFGIGVYTLSCWKVVWRRMVKELTAAVVGQKTVAGIQKPVVPQETLTFIPCKSEAEAHFLAAVLNSSAATEKARSFSVAGNKSFGSAGMLKHLTPPFYKSDDAIHRRLVELSHQAHRLIAERKQTDGIDEEISAIVAAHGLIV